MNFEVYKDNIIYIIFRHIMSDRMLSKKDFNLEYFFEFLYLRFEEVNGELMLIVDITQDPTFKLDYMLDQIYFEQIVMGVSINPKKMIDSRVGEINKQGVYPQNFKVFNSNFKLLNHSKKDNSKDCFLILQNPPYILYNNLINFFLLLLAKTKSEAALIKVDSSGANQMYTEGAEQKKSNKLIKQQVEKAVTILDKKDGSIRNDYMFIAAFQKLFLFLTVKNSTEKMESFKKEVCFFPDPILARGKIEKLVDIDRIDKQI